MTAEELKAKQLAMESEMKHLATKFGLEVEFRYYANWLTVVFSDRHVYPHWGRTFDILLKEVISCHAIDLQVSCIESALRKEIEARAKENTATTYITTRNPYFDVNRLGKKLIDEPVYKGGFVYPTPDKPVPIEKQHITLNPPPAESIKRFNEVLQKRIDEEFKVPESVLYKKHDDAIAAFCQTDIKITKELLNMLFGKKEDKTMRIKDVIFNPPATIVFWQDGTKTVVKAQDETFDPEKGLAMAYMKKHLGNEGNYFNTVKKWTEKYVPVEPKKGKVEKKLSGLEILSDFGKHYPDAPSHVWKTKIKNENKIKVQFERNGVMEKYIYDYDTKLLTTDN